MREMHCSGLCDFSGHRVSHTILSHVSRSEQELEVRQSKATLEEELGETAALFAYPEGQRNHFDESVVEVVWQAGFVAAASAIFGLNTPRASTFHLHRNMVDFVAPFNQCLEGAR